MELRRGSNKGLMCVCVCVGGGGGGGGGGGAGGKKRGFLVTGTYPLSKDPV